MRKSPAEAEEGAQETEFERFLQESGLNEAQAMGLLRAAYGRQMQLMERAQQVLAAVRAIGDENFTIEALQSNPEAMRALEEGGLRAAAMNAVIAAYEKTLQLKK